MGRKKLGTVGIYRNVMPHHVDKIDRYIKYLKDEDIEKHRRFRGKKLTNVNN